MQGLLLTAEGHSGIVELQEDRLYIRRPGLMAGISGQGDSQVALSAIVDVEYKEAGPHVNGWVRFRSREEEPRSLARSQLWSHPYVVFFTFEQREAFRRLTRLVHELIQRNGTR